MALKKPIRLEDIYRELGLKPRGILDLGYLNSNAHGKINKWSRHKPVRYTPDDDHLTEEQWRSTSYGVTMTDAGKTNDPTETAWRTTDAYVYNPPIKGKHPFRITDWLGSTTGETEAGITFAFPYNHSAEAPICRGNDIQLPERDPKGQIRFIPQRGAAVGSSEMLLSDFPALTSLYPCLILYYPEGFTPQWQWFTSANTFASQAGDCYMEVLRKDLPKPSNWADIEVKYYRCAASKMQTTPIATQNGATFHQLPKDSHELYDGTIVIKGAMDFPDFQCHGIIGANSAPGAATVTTKFWRAARYQRSRASFRAPYYALGLGAPVQGKSATLLLRISNNDGLDIPLRIQASNLWCYTSESQNAPNAGQCTLYKVSAEPEWTEGAVDSLTAQTQQLTLTKITETTIPVGGDGIFAIRLPNDVFIDTLNAQPTEEKGKPMYTNLYMVLNIDAEIPPLAIVDRPQGHIGSWQCTEIPISIVDQSGDLLVQSKSDPSIVV